MDVLVIGAGPVGLSAALELSAEGIPCRIVEKREAPSELSRAVGIMPEDAATSQLVQGWGKKSENFLAESNDGIRHGRRDMPGGGGYVPATPS